MNTHGTSNSHGQTTSDRLVATGKANLTGINFSATSGDETITVYDNTSASGKIIFKFIFSEFGTDSKSYYVYMPHGGIRCKIGIFVDITPGGRYVTHWN